MVLINKYCHSNCWRWFSSIVGSSTNCWENSIVMILLIVLCCNVIIVPSVSAAISSDYSSYKRSKIEDYAKAFDHGVRVRSEGSCNRPHPTIIYVNTTDHSKVYLPRGTVLHRCSDMTGLCENPTESCIPIEMQTVELYFLTISFEIHSKRHKNGGRGVRQSRNIEKLLFTNHTRCGCRIRTTTTPTILNNDNDEEFDENQLK